MFKKKVKVTRYIDLTMSVLLARLPQLCTAVCLKHTQPAKYVFLSGFSKLTTNVRLHSNIPRVKLTRGNESGRFSRAAKKAFERPASSTPISLSRAMLIGGACMGLGSLCFYGIFSKTDNSIAINSVMWPSYVRTRLRTTFLYLTGSLGLCAASAYVLIQQPAVHRMFASAGPLGMFGLFALTMGTSILCRSIPYSPDSVVKHLAWIAHCSSVGLLIAPVCLLGGPLLTQAAVITSGIVGGLSLVAATAPSEKFLYLAGPLSIGLGAVIASSFAGMFVSRATMLGATLSSISVYGGMGVFSLLLLFNTQRVVRVAETYPVQTYNVPPYDPIDNAMGLYINIINIFINVVSMLGNGGRRK